MKNSLFLLFSFSVLIFSCKKIDDKLTPVITKTNIKKTRNTNNVIYLNGTSTPYYSSFDDFKVKYEILESAYLTSLQNTYLAYPDGFNENQLESTLPLDVFNIAISPLLNNGSNNGFNSLYSQYNIEKLEWLSHGYDNFNSFPANRYVINDQLMAMMNKDGNYIVGDKIVHFVFDITKDTCNFIEVATLEVPLSDSIDFWNTSSNDLNNINAFKAHTWPPKWIPNLLDLYADSTCKVNVGNSDVYEYANKRKYYWKNGFFNDVISTVCHSQMEAYYKTKVLGWIPNVLSMKIRMQETHYNPSCSEGASQYGETGFWCSILPKAYTHWMVRRTCNKQEIYNIHETNGDYPSSYTHFLNW